MDTHNHSNKINNNYKISIIPTSNLLKFKIKFKHSNPPNHRHADDESEKYKILDDGINPRINTNQDSYREEDGGLKICPYCDKGFTTDKALGGHMRIHAGRKRKGMHSRPGVVGSGFGSGKAYLRAVKRLKGLGGWGLTGVRTSSAGRYYYATSSSDEVMTSLRSGGGYGGAEVAAGENMVLRCEGESGPLDRGGAEVAAGETMVLCCEGESGPLDGGGGIRNYDDGGSKKRKLKEYDSDEIYYLRNMGYFNKYDDNVDDLERGESGPLDRGGAEVAAGENMVLRCEGESGPLDGGGGIRDYDDGGIKKRKLKEFDSDEMYYLRNMGYFKNYDDDVDDLGRGEVINGNKGIVTRDTHENSKIGNGISVNNIDKWKCNICNKSFATHQALGGHKSSHNKDRLNPNLDTVGDGSVNSGSGLVNSRWGGVIGVHKCKTCGKTFTSGQALGGHQRCHYVAQDPNSWVSPGRSSSQSGLTKDVGNGFLDIDLNVMPLEDGVVDSTLDLFSY